MTPLKLNWTGTLARMFAENRSLALLMVVVALAFGVIGYTKTPKQYNPEITRPAFLVSVPYPGATPEEGYRLVGRELVEKVSALAGVDEVTLVASDGGRVDAVVIFDVGYEEAVARVNLQTQLTQHSYLARGDIHTPSVRELDPDEVPVLTLRLVAPDKSPAELRHAAHALSTRILEVPDVAGVDVHGGYAPALVVELDPQALARTGVTLGEVLTSVRAASHEYPLSSINTGERIVLLDIQNAGSAPETLAEVALTPRVRVGDVATLYRGTTEVAAYTRYALAGEAPEDAVLLAIAKRDGASAPVVAEEVQAALDRALAEPEYKGLSYEVVNNDGALAAREIRGLMINLVQSLLIVGAVLVLFLSPRAALVVMISIPLTMLIVFGAGYLAGQTVNRITLFALILSMGLLVDAAIVVIEAVHSSLKGATAEDTRVERVVRSVNSVGIGLFLSMVTSIVVFLPMRFITGMMGPYMGPIAFFVPAALLVSFLVAVTIMPYLALALLPHGEKPHPLGSWLERVMARVTAGYERMLVALLESRKRQRTLLLSVLVLLTGALVLPLVGLTHFQMLPKADRDQYYMHIDLHPGVDVVRTRTEAEALTARVLDDPDARAAQLFVATPPVLDFNGMFKGAHLRSAPHQASIRVDLVPSDERTRSSTDIVNDARARIEEYVEKSDAVASVRLVEDPPGPPVRATFVAKVSSQSDDARDVVAEALTTQVRVTEGLVDLDTSMERGYERMVLVVDHVAARAYGVSPARIEDAIRLMGGPVEAGQWHLDGSEEYARIEARIPRDARRAPSSLEATTVRSERGTSVPLASVVDIEYVRDRESIMTEGVVPTLYITAEAEGRSIVYAMLDLMATLRHEGIGDFSVESWSLWGMTLTDGAHRVQLDWGGEWEMTLENFRDLGLAMLAALLLVYAVLVAQYRSFSVPLLVLSTVPLGLIGILAGFSVLDAVAGVYLTATALIGFIALIGIVVNNAIILLERFDEARAEGATHRDAMRDAARSRLRPIVLTSLTTVLGSLTIAFDPVWSGLAWSIVFGLSFSAVLSLIVFPVLLAYFVWPRDTVA